MKDEHNLIMAKAHNKFCEKIDEKIGFYSQ